MDPRQPPAGQCYATYTCTAGLFPNVCGNAKSAIDRRGKTSILTYQVGNRDTLSAGAVRPWYDGHFRSPRNRVPQAGWALQGCEVEEYPWGNGNPTQINNDDFDSQAVLRLIPGGSTTDQGNGENGEHGRHIYSWLQSMARQYNQAAANDPNANLFQRNSQGQISPEGLVYCVGFESGFTADLPEDSLNNRCARPYGTAFTLVNWVETNRASGTTSYRWDPWFDAVPGRKQRRVVNVDDNGNELTAVIPPIYCEYPSPGALAYDRVNDLYTLATGFQQVDRPPNDRTWDYCIDVIDAQSSPGPEKRWLLDPADAYSLILNDSAIPANSTKADRDHARHLLRTDSFETRGLVEGVPEKRQAAGAFLDPAVYRYYGCGGQDGSIEDVVRENEADYCTPAGNCPAIVPVEISGTDGDVPVGPGTPNDPSEPSDPSEPTTTPTITQPHSTSTSYISCETQNQQPGQGITQAHCICDGSTFPKLTATDPPNSCAYTTKPGSSATISITRLPTPTAAPRPVGAVDIFQRRQITALCPTFFCNKERYFWIAMDRSFDTNEDFCYVEAEDYLSISADNDDIVPTNNDQISGFDLPRGGHFGCFYSPGSVEERLPGQLRCESGYKSQCSFTDLWYDNFAPNEPPYRTERCHNYEDGRRVVEDDWIHTLVCNYITADDLSRISSESSGNFRTLAQEEPDYSYWEPQDSTELPSPSRPPLSDADQWFLDIMVNGTSTINIEEALREETVVDGDEYLW